MGQIRWNIGERIIGVDQAPIVQRIAVVQERVVLLKGGRIEVEPLAMATVEILNSTVSLRKANDSQACLKGNKYCFKENGKVDIPSDYNFLPTLCGPSVPFGALRHRSAMSALRHLRPESN